MRIMLLVSITLLTFSACTKNTCNSPKAICCDVYSHKKIQYSHSEYNPPLLKSDKTGHKYLRCNKIIISSSNIIYGSFSGTLLYNMEALYKTAMNELCFFVGCLDDKDKLVWINVVNTGVNYYSLSDLGYAVDADKNGEVIAAFTTTGKCKIIDCITGIDIDLCADGVLGICFDQAGKLLWSYDYGSDWASPTRICIDNNYVILSVCNNGDFQCGCEGKEIKKFEFADIKYRIHL